MQVEKKPGWKRGMKVATHPSYYNLISERARYLVRMPPGRGSRQHDLLFKDEAGLLPKRPSRKEAIIDRGMRKIFVLLARAS